MKVVHIIGSLNRGGMENLLFDLFKKTKNKFHLICIHRKRGNLYDYFERTGVPMQELPVQKRSVFLYIKKLRNLLIKEKVDIVHCHQSIDAFMTYFATIGLKTKTILTLHGHGVRDKFIRNCLRRFVIKHVDTVLFVSNFTKKFYLNKFRLTDLPKFLVLWNGIDFEKFNFKKQSTIQHEFKIKNDVLILGCVGNFSSGRDQMTICRFLAKFVRKRNDFLFLFIGLKTSSEPELFDNCVSYCQQNGLERNVKFLGVREDVPQILPQLDAFIYSSVHDTFGIAIIEAMYVGIPVFLNDWKAMLEITDNGKYATIYRSKDEGDLLQKFNHFLENRKEYTQKARLAKEFATNNYSINSHIQNLKKIYHSVLTT